MYCDVCADDLPGRTCFVCLSHEDSPDESDTDRPSSPSKRSVSVGKASITISVAQNLVLEGKSTTGNSTTIPPTDVSINTSGRQVEKKVSTSPSLTHQSSPQPVTSPEKMCAMCNSEISHPHVLPCDHQFCQACVDAATKKGIDRCPTCGADMRKCEICFDSISEAKALRCGHEFCSPCLDDLKKSGHYLCPSCRQPFAAVSGNQPRQGTMTVSHTNSGQPLPGYPNCGVVVIQYHFPHGTQEIGQPNPGKAYSGTSRTAFLPDNAEGNDILRLLRKAFDARVTFTVGRSTTTGCDNTVVWNDIHHKTSMSGGPSK